MTPERLEELNAKCVAWMMKTIKDEGYTEKDIQEYAKAMREQNAKIDAAVEAENYELYAEALGEDPNDRHTKRGWQQKMWLKRRREESEREESEIDEHKTENEKAGRA